jgi:hypothetical protein
MKTETGENDEFPVPKEGTGYGVGNLPTPYDKAFWDSKAPDTWLQFPE